MTTQTFHKHILSPTFVANIIQANDLENHRGDTVPKFRYVTNQNIQPGENFLESYTSDLKH